ncbi:hypothetical protein ACLUWU_03280 [Bifidobacterium thermophilum]|uniref:hypothetical protein n=1 Tax=Bifidobacterium thermophilum TaxID=33905 RepID=UPI003992AFA6
MKESVLWRRLDRAVGTRLRARYKNRESGVAMVMALMFILVVLLTSTLLLGILLSQALPYRNNARNAQGKVAAEAGLQAGLSFLRTAESYYETGNYSKLMPAAAADPSKPSLDETYAMETATTSGSTTGTVNVVALNYVPVDDTSSGTTAVSTSSATHNQKLSYRIQIGYYDGDPDAGGKMVTDATKLSSVKYAVVVSYGYVNRYPDGRTSGTETDPVRTAAAKYKFGQATEKTQIHGTGHNGAASVSFVQSKQNDRWVHVTSATFTANNDLDTVTADSDWSMTKTIPDPRSSLCMVASNGSDGTPLKESDFIDANTGKYSDDIFNAKIKNAVMRLFRRATSTDNGPFTFKYSSYCQAHGEYKYTNNWIYYDDDSIRLAHWSDDGTTLVPTNWCVTGLSVQNAQANAAPARLTECGTSYSPKVTGTQTVPGANHGYSLQAEHNDADSQLMKSQKWGFYFAFINAAYLNKDSSGQYTQIAEGPLSWGNTMYEQLIATQTHFADLNGDNDFHRSCDTNPGGNNASNAQFDGTKECYLQASRWSTSLHASGLDTTNEYFSSLGSAGEAGWETHQIVSDTGYCMNALGASTSGDVLTFLCSVNAAPLRPFCNAGAINIMGGGNTNTSVAPQCPTISGDSTWSGIGGGAWQNDYITYTKGGDATVNKTTGMVESVEPSTTTLTFEVVDNNGKKPGCFVVTGTSVGGTLQSKEGQCTGDPKATFYRYENVADETREPEKARFNFTFVLASSVSDKTKPWLSPDALCLTETTGLPNWQRDERVQLQKCQGAMTDDVGALYYPQRWNATDKSHNNTSGLGGSKEYRVDTKASISYASSKYVDAANWKW